MLNKKLYTIVYKYTDTADDEDLTQVISDSIEKITEHLQELTGVTTYDVKTVDRIEESVDGLPIVSFVNKHAHDELFCYYEVVELKWL